MALHVAAGSLSHGARAFRMVDEADENIDCLRNVRFGPDLIFGMRIFSRIHGHQRVIDRERDPDEPGLGLTLREPDAERYRRA